MSAAKQKKASKTMPTTKPKTKKPVAVKSGGKVSVKKGKAKGKPLALPLTVFFEGKEVLISPRVLTAWERIRNDSSVTDLVESTASAIDRKRHQPMIKLLTSEINKRKSREKYYQENPYGPNIFDDRVKLHIAINDGDENAIRNLARKLAKKGNGSSTNAARSWPKEDWVLLVNWFDRSGICLAWMSDGALDLILGYAGLNQVERDGALAIKSRLFRLGLKGVKPSIVKKKHIRIEGKTLFID